MTRDELFDILCPIVNTVTGVNVVLADEPGAPSPSGQYIALEPMSTLTERGQATVKTSPLNRDVATTVSRKLISECSINVYRGNARDVAFKLKECNKRPDVSVALFKAGIGWQRTGPVNNLTALQNNKMEQRAQISIYLMFEDSDTVITNSIESVGVAVESETGSTLQQTEVILNG